jgi:hypothetical protein
VAVVAADLGSAMHKGARMKKIVDRETAEKLRELVRMGKARVVKEYVNGDPEIFIYSPGESLMAIIGKQHRYIFEAALIEHGSMDGLLDGFDQTTVPVP